MFNKKDRMQTSKLSSTVLDYYYKYGQNRDLEKYLRLKRQSTSKSSSDSSLKNYGSADSSTLDCKRITKSMEKLNFSDRKIQFNDEHSDHDQQRNRSNTNPNADESNRNKLEYKKKPDESQPIKIGKKTQHQWKSKSKSKSYNFNVESSIEINLPTTSSMPALPVSTQTIGIDAESSETQTDEIPMEPDPSKPKHTNEPTIAPSNLNTPAVERKTDHKKSKAVEATAAAATATATATTTMTTPTMELVQETSPASSVASAAKLRLEWDSMADIGYNRFIDFKSQSNSNLTTFERSALTKFFAKRGLNFDDNLVILAPPTTTSATITDTKSPLQRRKFTQSAIEMREAQKIRADLTSATKKLSPATDKRLWERALMKYREKYGNISLKAHKCESDDTTQFMVPPHHSTPFPSDISKISQCGTEDFSGQSKDTPIQVDASKKQQGTPLPPTSPTPSPRPPPLPQRVEKWCQTSLIDVEAIGIQVEQEQQPKIQQASKSVQIEIEQVNESTQKDDYDLTTATSFEFLAPSAYNKNRNEVIEQMSSNNIPITMLTARQDIPQRYENDRIYVQEENPDDKENIPPIEDKENIPPPQSLPLALQNTEQPNVFKTPPDQSIAAATAAKSNVSAGGDSSVLSNELQIGVDLINAMIESHCTDAATKKKLIRKIVRHLLRSKDTKGIAQMIISYTTDKSDSKISGVIHMSDDISEKNNDSRIKKKTANDSISGISTLNSSSSNVSQDVKALASSESDQMTSNIREDKQLQSYPNVVQQRYLKVKPIENKKTLQNDERRKDNENSKKDSKIVKEWLLPATQSEIEKEMSRKLSRSQQHTTETNLSNEQLNDIASISSQIDNRQAEYVKEKMEIFNRLKKEKKTEFDWIDQEIEQLKNLKQLLKQINTSESDGQSASSRGGNISDEKTNSVYAKHNRNYFAIYENFRRTHKQPGIRGSDESQADESSTLIDSSKSSDNSSRYHGKMGSKSHWIHKTTLESPSSTISSGSKPIDNHKSPDDQSSPSLAAPVNTQTVKLAQWDSHLNMQQLVKNRTKLKTPNSDSESIEAYAKACRTEFDRKCAKSQNPKYHHQITAAGESAAAAAAAAAVTAEATAIAKSTTKALIEIISERDQPIYTKPYSSDSYSDIGQNVRKRSAITTTTTGHGRLKGKQQTDIIVGDAYSSVTSSDGFLSPNSISIGIAANSTSNTTTHQYDTKISVGLQTTDTLKRMPIIQLKNPKETVNETIEQTSKSQTAPETGAAAAVAKTTTLRVNKFTVNKQLQARPESLAYIIVFKDNDGRAATADENGNPMGQERGNQLYGNAKQRNSMLQPNLNSNSDRSRSSIPDVQIQNSKDELENKKGEMANDSNGNSRSHSNSSLGSSFENLTLQEHLQAHRPDFYANAEKRRKCLNNLHNLRQQRNEQRKKLLATNVSSNAKILNRNMKRLLPPPPLAQMRIFKSREIISQTRRKYQKLPEIQRRQQMERDMKIRRNQRILVNVFSKNLQKHVLSGKTDLSNSIMLN